MVKLIKIIILFLVLLFSCTNKTVKEDENLITEVESTNETAVQDVEIENKNKKEIKKEEKKFNHQKFFDDFKYKPTNTILVILPLSGEKENVGKRIKTAIELTNSVLDEEYNLSFFDTESEIYYKVHEIYDEILKVKPKFIIGGIDREETLNIVGPASVADIPLFTFANDELLNGIYNKLYIQSITIENIVYSIVKFALEESLYKKFAIFYPVNEHGFEYLEYFNKFVNEGGGEVVKIVGFDTRSKNLDKSVAALVERDNPYKREDFLRKIKKAEEIKDPYKKQKFIEFEKVKLKPKYEFEALFAPISFKQLNQIIPLFAAWDIPLFTRDPVLMEQVYHKYLNKNQKYVQVFGIPSWYNKTIFKDGNKYINGLIFPSPFAINLTDFSHPFNELFNEIKQNDRIYEALVYDLLHIIYEIIDKKNMKIDEFEGVMGSYIFYKNQLFKNLVPVLIDREEFIPQQ